MTAPLDSLRWLMVFSLVGCTTDASAQVAGRPAPATSALAQARIPIGDVLRVTDSTGATTKGKLIDIADDGLSLSVGTGVRRIVAGDIRRVEWKRTDSLLNGLLIGAAIGAVPGLYWLVADPNECTGMCAEEYAFIGIGGVAGGLIDYARSKKAIVYAEGQSTAATRTISIGPFAARGRKGIMLALRF